MANKGRNGDNDDNGLWGAFIKGITPLRKREKTPKAPPKQSRIKRERTLSAAAPQPSRHMSENTAPDNGLDRKTLQKFQKGKMTIEGRVDLHGMSQDKAYQALKNFLLLSFDQNRRCVLVITGKGEGVLKSQLPHWIGRSPLSDIVLRCDPAQQKHGGGGAFYVYLKRPRP